MITVNPYGIGVPLQGSTTLAQPDPAAVQLFQSALSAPSSPTAVAQSDPAAPVDATTSEEATDEELAKLSSADLDALRARWGDDEHGFRTEAKTMLQVNTGINDSIVRKMVADTFKLKHVFKDA